MRKPPSGRYERANQRAARQLAKMQPLRTAMIGFNGDFWAFVRERLRQKLEALRWARSIQNIAKFTNPAEAGLKLATILAQEEAVEGILSMPDEISAMLKMMEEEYRKTCAISGDEEALEKNKL